jgi:hypothetical protein
MTDFKPPTVIYKVPQLAVPVGHTEVLVHKVEFSVSTRGWLRCMATVDRPVHERGGALKTWLSINPCRAPWLGELVDDVLPRLPEGRLAP